MFFLTLTEVPVSKEQIVKTVISTLKRASAMFSTRRVGIHHSSCGIDIKRFRKHNFYCPELRMIVNLCAPKLCTKKTKQAFIHSIAAPVQTTKHALTKAGHNPIILML